VLGNHGLAESSPLKGLKARKIKGFSQTHFIPVQFELPESLKETMPATKVMAIEGQLILRFYCPPMHEDIIEHRGHLWRVMGYYHKSLKKGSRGQDEIPVIHPKHLGAKLG
jgi:hypothetical protein